METTLSFGDILEAADRLPVEDQESLLDILQRRLVEHRRGQVARDIEEGRIRDGERLQFGAFEVGSGFTEAQRREYYNDTSLIGKLITIKYQPAGMKDKPRFPTFKGFRHPDDT